MSNLIKYSHYIDVNDKKIINVIQRTLSPVKDEQSSKPVNASDAEQEIIDKMAEAEAQIQDVKNQIVKDAEEYAEKQISQAMEEAVLIKKQAEDEINQWWEERRKLDNQHVEEAKSGGFEQGYQEGIVKAEAAVREEYSKTLEESRSILELAHTQKQQIIQEAEPFLIELSCAISQKIIHQQLTVAQDWIVGLIKQALARKREQGIITLCVSPIQFTSIQDAREELTLAIDSQAELQILPDGTVEDYGCVIRSSFGSIDARIDTQLSEIKNALYQLAVRDADVELHD